MHKIKIGLVGYGNLARGVEGNISLNEDMEIVAIFSRRKNIKAKYPVHGMDELSSFVGKIDVMILCGGSANDLPKQGVEVLKLFNTVDSFDTHALIPEYLDKMDAVGKLSGKLGIVSVGWDPGLFSIARALFGAYLPDGDNYTFWGKGVSQGHSDAIRNVAGVLRGIQYTIPKQEALDKVRSGERVELSAREKHLRECFVVAEDKADKSAIEKEIINMPNYFADYDTVVHFITLKEFEANHTAMPHGGFVMRSGEANGSRDLLELSIKLDSNPSFTSGILLAYARAVYRMSRQKCGAVTVFDVPLTYLSSIDRHELIKRLL